MHQVAGTFEPTEPVDRFRIASVSKVITAIVTLQLVEDGLLAVDEPVGERVASYLGVTPTSAAAQITVEQLLSHTSDWDVWLSSCSTVICAAAEVGVTPRYDATRSPTGSSTASKPSSTSCRVTIAVITFDTLAMRKRSTGSVGSNVPATRTPYPEACTRSPSIITATDADVSPCTSRS